MARVTRQQAKVRQAEGNPPSPPPELPAARRKKRAPKSTQTVITPEDIEDEASSSQQDQAVPDQTLREGNAGGYVHHAQDAESTREQQDSLSDDADAFPLNSTSKEPLASLERASPEFRVASLEAGPEAGPEVINTTTPSPSNTSVLFAQVLSSPVTPSSSGLAPMVVASPQIAQALSARVSPSPSGLAPTAVASLQTIGEPSTGLQSVSTQTDGLAASVASPVIHITSQSDRQAVVVRDVSVQTNPHHETFKTISRYGFNSDISVIPESCDITLHLGGGREIRITKVSEMSIRKFSDILEKQREVSYERNWLTTAELAEAKQAAADTRLAAAAAEAQMLLSAENKRKRDEQIIEMPEPESQRRRMNPSPTPAPKPTQKSKRRMLWGRSGMGKSLRATQMALARRSPSSEHEVNPYNTNGELSLAGKTNSNDQQDDLIYEGPTGGNAMTDIVNADNAPPSDTQLMTAAPEADGVGGLAATQNDQQPPQTPQRGSWLPSMFTSALSYVPSIRRRQAPATPRANAPISRDHRVAQTEPRRPMPAHSDFGQRLLISQAAAQKSFRSKENIDSMRRVKEERDRIAFEWAKLEEQRKVTEEARRLAEEDRKVTEQEKQDVADAHRAALASQKIGSKRQRISPRVIPNPKGVSFGLDEDFFCDSDSESGGEEDPDTSRKSRRTSGPDHSSSDPTPNKYSAMAKRSYTSPSDRANKYTGSRFADSPPNVFGQSTTYTGLTISKDDPNFNHSGHFEVPWSPSSSEGDSGEEDEVATPAVDKPQSLAPSPTQGTAAQTSDSTVTTASPQKPAQEPMFPPTTPAQRFNGAAAADKVWDPEAAKTLERNRELLRAKIAGHSRSVLSPKDIQNSPSKPHVFSQPETQSTVQPTETPLFFQPKQVDTGVANASAEEPTGSWDVNNGFSILGAAKKTSPKSTAQKLTETLPFVQERLNGLQSYDSYQQTMDAKAKALVESSWEARDETVAIEDFRSTFTHYLAAQKEDAAVAAPSHSETPRRIVDDDDITDDEDDESLYDDDDDEGDDDEEYHEDVGDSEDEELLDESEEDDQPQVHTLPTPNAFENFHMNPKVAAFLNAQWTPEDEAHASEEFKTQLASASQAAF
ncbi:MAG: hypothetical protein Q9169_004146 [Polycauliona sp. 2 TL-2023]